MHAIRTPKNRLCALCRQMIVLSQPRITTSIAKPFGSGTYHTACYEDYLLHSPRQGSRSHCSKGAYGSWRGRPTVRQLAQAFRSPG